MEHNIGFNPNLNTNNASSKQKNHKNGAFADVFSNKIADIENIETIKTSDNLPLSTNTPLKEEPPTEDRY
jgi:hypothetical protein